MKKKILIYSSSYLPTTGGVQYFLYWLLKALDKKRSNLEIFFVTHNSSKFSKFKFINTKIIEEKDFFKNYISMYKFIQKNEINTIVTFNLIRDTILFVWLKIFFNFKLICNAQGDDLAFDKKFNYGARLKYRNNFIFHFVKYFTDLIIVASRSMFDFATKSGVNNKKLLLIRNGIEIASYEKISYISKIKQKYKIKNNELVFLCISGHRKIKNVEGIIKSLSKFKEKYKLILCSHGEETNNLKKLSKKLNIYNNIIFMKFVKGVKKKEIFKISDVYINLAYFEPFGLTYLEALNYRLAIIGSCYGGAKDIFKNNYDAIIVNPYNKKQVLSSIKKIFQKKVRSKLLKNSKRKLEFFDIQIVSRLFAKAF